MRRESNMLARMVNAEMASASVSALRSSSAVSLTGIALGAESEPRPPGEAERDPSTP
jgi:nicotinamide mononucleotide (NMN) deamidase PncC